MDARAFLISDSQSRLRGRADFAEWLAAALNMAVGLAIFFGVARWIPPDHESLIAWTGMLGLVMALHFGLFHLLSCLWRSLGVDAPPIMSWPLAATSVADFWGRRWNMAFRDLTHRFLFLPLVPLCGPRRAILVAFLISGLIHELVITVPAGGGYGGPTAFFFAQAVVLFVQRGRRARQLRLDSGWPGWLVTMTALLAPLYILFPPAFLDRVVIPFMAAAGAL